MNSSPKPGRWLTTLRTEIDPNDYLGLGSEAPIRLLEPLKFLRHSGLQINVPAGFCCDWASVPTVFRSFVPPFWWTAAAATVHDYLVGERPAAREIAVPRQEADLIFWEALMATKVKSSDAEHMYDAVALYTALKGRIA